MNHCVGSDWTPERCVERFAERVEFYPDGCFFATVDDRPVGTAAGWIKPDSPPATGWVEMVGVHPEHRGRGLGAVVTLSVLRWMRSRGLRRAVLTTDDWRLPAIHTYLKLGFEPVIFDGTHQQRWEAVRARLTAGREEQAAVR
jgi:mycothiol synthase